MCNTLPHPRPAKYRNADPLHSCSEPGPRGFRAQCQMQHWMLYVKITQGKEHSCVPLMLGWTQRTQDAVLSSLAT
jgi:hypothetical protein